MKKLLSLLIILVAFSACETDVKFNDPGFQARKDNFLWRSDLTAAGFESDDVTVDPNNGVMTITANKGLEIVTLKLPFNLTVPINKLSPLVYQYGYNNVDSSTDDEISASYVYAEDATSLEYVAGFGFNEDLIDKGNIQITVNAYDPVEKTISGFFKFNAKYQGDSSLVPENVNFQEGAFYNIPIF